MRVLLTCALGLAAVIPAAADAPLDFVVYGPAFYATENEDPTNRLPGQEQAPGTTIYILCQFDGKKTAGTVSPKPPPAVEFRFQVNGKTTRQVMAPTPVEQPISMGEIWTVPAAGTYLIACEVNHTHSYPEADYTNNRGEKAFAGSKPALRSPKPALGPNADKGGVAQVIPPGAAALPTGSKRARASESARGRSSEQSEQGRRRLPPVSVFANPTWKGKRVDWCLYSGKECGEPAALEFCARRAYANKASAWTIAEGVGPTWSLGDGKACEAADCDGFASITCLK